MNAPVSPIEPLLRSEVKCLIVDDLEENLIALSALLRDDDVQVLTARSGPEALELLLVNEVALAFLDVQMPGMDGFELAELMRGSDRTRQVPIIFLTAGSRDQHRLFKGYEAGGVDFIYKPIEPAVLKNKASVFFSLQRHKLQLAAELQERTRTLRWNEMFTATLGHDLRNPLAAILASAEFIQLCAKDYQSQKAAARVVASANRMSRMIEQLFDLARARLGDGIAIRRERMDFGALVERVVQEHRSALPDRKISLHRDPALSGLWDADRVAQIVSNLVGNALSHGDKAGTVDVSVRAGKADDVVLSVSNDGHIPSEQLAQIFDPFHGGQRHGPNSGLGLGLYIVQQIALAHGGQVDVRSADNRVAFDVTMPRTANLRSLEL